MRLVIQRVKSASVQVEGQVIGQIEKGYLILVGVSQDDTKEDLAYCVRKVVNMRLFEDDEERMNLSIRDVEGQILSVSQFTLLADTKKGNRPSFIRAGQPQVADAFYEEFNKLLREAGIPVETGQFGAHMTVSLDNDGPVTIILDSQNK